ncbi:hypothetical protein [Streptomyces triticirhizae]|uniref:DUF2771 domain-containing protein n=1 Tax=Streptomyces triticirhizae TaxID=2483353 RepID=A0A3M2M5U4_9ACTN|nr:hypothetical protein [Streptomyces triticirhizae]RMI43875.1 hypothetical protein EBN88_06375 [Streptomyces triticirhizae]
MTATARNRGRRAIRTTLAIGTVSLGVLVLSACEKPSPNAHFTLESSSKTRETASDCYGHGEALGAERAMECLSSDDNRATFSSTPGDTFRIGVDTEIAEEGWLLFVNDQLYRAEPFTGTYRSFPSDQLFQMVQQQAEPGSPPVAEDLRLSVAQVREDYDIETIWASQSEEEFQENLFGSVEGVWNATLTPGD